MFVDGERVRREGSCGIIGGIMFLDFMVPRSVIAGCEGRYARIVGDIENRTRVESLAKPASTLMKLVFIGIVFSQSMKRSGEKSVGWTSSEMRMLKRRRGYSGGDDRDVVGDAAEAF
jgi:hypothetical protein